ncbi:MAG: glycyl-radical enzyme activating protein, partial [Planctomycetes bacterium]|nr:glycyl-radical enzyme activating protein [Planctomycetota bacterium]
ENLVRVDEQARHYQVRLVVRIPVIPGVNDDSKTLHATGAFLANLENLDHVQLLPYHRLGVDTYQKLGRPYPLEDVRSPDAEQMEESRDLVRAYVRNVI